MASLKHMIAFKCLGIPSSEQVIPFHHYEPIDELIAQLLEPCLLQQFCWLEDQSLTKVQQV